MKCDICQSPPPLEFQPVYHRPYVPPPRVLAHSRPGYFSNQGRLLHRITALTIDQIALMLTMRNAGQDQYAIAKALKVNQATISRSLAKFPDTRTIAKQRLIAHANAMATHVIMAAKTAAAEGDAGPALEVLDRLDVLSAKRQAPPAVGGTRVLVVVGGTPEAARINAFPDFEETPALTE